MCLREEMDVSSIGSPDLHRMELQSEARSFFADSLVMRPTRELQNRVSAVER